MNEVSDERRNQEWRFWEKQWWWTQRVWTQWEEGCGSEGNKMGLNVLNEFIYYNLLKKKFGK